MRGMVKTKTLVKVILIGVIEMSNRMGAQALYDWLQAIGERLGEMEGKGIEGVKCGDLHYEPLCPLATLLDIEHYYDVLPKSADEYPICKIDRGADKPACADIICIIHHAYLRKRAELAGKKFFHLAAKSPTTGEIVFNEEAIKAVGKNKDEIKALMEEKAVCVFMYK